MEGFITENMGRLPRSWGIRIGSVGLVVTFLALNVHAQTSITVPASTATGIALASAANYKIAHDALWKDYEDLLEIAVLNEVSKAAANSGQSSSVNYSAILAQVRNLLDSNPPKNPTFPDEAACLRYGIDQLVNPSSGTSLLSNPTTSLLPAVLATLENLKFTQLETHLSRGASRSYPAELALPSAAGAAYQLIEDSVQQAVDLAFNDPAYAAIINPVLRDLIGLDSGASYSQVQTSFSNGIPTLPSPNNDGSFTVNYQDLITQYTSIIANIQSATSNTLGNVQTAGFISSDASTAVHSPAATDSGLSSPSASGAPTSCTAGTAPAGSVIISADQCTQTTAMSPDDWSKAQSDVDGLSKVVNHFDPAVAKQISTAGTAMVDAGKAIAQIQTILSSGFSITNAVALATPVGALLGAGSAIYSLFSNSASMDANAAVLAQIKTLGAQIAALQRDVDIQFKQVDGTLTTILATFSQDFAQLNTDANTIQGELLDLQAQLNQIELYSQLWAQTQEYENLQTYLNGCIDYRHNNPGAPDIGLQFNTCENNLFTWANNNVIDPLWAGAYSDYSDGAIYNTLLNNSLSGVCSLCSTPFSTLVNYLAQFPAQNQTLGQSLPALSLSRLPNPEMWKLSARGYLQLLREWPQYTVNKDPGSLGDIVTLGKSLQSAIHNANSINNNPNTPNQALFSALVNKYNNKASALKQSISNYETNQFIPNNTCTSANYSNPPCIPPHVNLWAPPGQQTTYVPPLVINGCGPDGFVDGNHILNLALPAGIFYAVPPALLIADSTVGSQLSICIVPFYTPGPDPSQPDIVRLNMTINIAYDRALVASMTLVAGGTGGEYFVCYDCGLDLSQNPWWYLQGPSMEQAQGWQVPRYPDLSGNIFTLKGEFENHSYLSLSVQPWAQALYNTLQGKERSFYSEISTQFTNTAVGLGAAIYTAANDLSGMKTLLTAYVNFGLPTFLQTNDILRSLLYGSGSILDGPNIQQLYSIAGQASVPQNPELDLTASTTPPSSSLGQAINAVLGQITLSQRPDSSNEIDTLLSDLNAFNVLQRNSTSVSGNPSGALAFCDFNLAPSLVVRDSAGGAASVAVTVATGGNYCNWAASTGATWLTITSGGTNSGPGNVRLSMAPATAGAARAAIVIIGDQVYRAIEGSNTSASAHFLGGSVSITSTGFVYSRVSQTFNGTFTITNVSSQPISGPLQLVLTGVPPGVTVANATGTYIGSAYLTAPGVSTLAAGASATISVKFSNPSNTTILFTPLAYSGVF